MAVKCITALSLYVKTKIFPDVASTSFSKLWDFLDRFDLEQSCASFYD